MNTKRKSHMVMRKLRFLIIFLVIGGLSNVAFGETWSGSRLIPNGYLSPVGPALVTFNGKLYSVVKGTDSKLYVFNSPDGTAWGGVYAIPGQSTTHTPAVEVFNNKIYCVYKSVNSNDIVVTSSSDGANWSAAYFITPRMTPDTPSIAVFNGRLYCVVKGATTNYIYVFSTGDGTTWNASYTIPNASTPLAPAVTVFNNKLYCLVKGNGNNYIYVMSSSDGASWSSPYYIPGQTTPLTPAVTVYNNKLYCIFKGNSSNNIVVTSSSDGASWGAAHYIPNQTTPDTPALEVFNNKLYCQYKADFGSNNIYVTDASEPIDVALNVTSYGQQTNMWCWATSGEMIMTYLGATVNVTQCIQANNRFNRNDCCNNFQNCVIGGWPEFDKYGFRYESTAWDTALTFAQLKAQFDNNRPIGFCWGWTDGGGHYMVARGYHEDTATGVQQVYVNDPWPWNADKNAGGAQRLISYAEFVAAADHTTWRNDYDIIKN